MTYQNFNIFNNFKMILNFKLQILNSKGGFIVSIVAFFVLMIMLTIAIAMSSLIFYRQKISTNAVKSTQSYYVAEAGIEDSLMRLRNNPQMQPVSYVLSAGDANTSITIPSIIGGSRVITSQGDFVGRIRKIQATYSTDGDQASFFYGVQVGAGGLIMSNSAEVKGNVFSNGNIVGTQSNTIENNVIVAGNGNKLEKVRVKGDAMVYSCINSQIDGNLTYVTGGTNTCNIVGSTSTQSIAIPTQPLPISQAQIDDWKGEAANGGAISGNLTLIGSQAQSIGPVKITGNLTLSNSAVLTLTGTVYVQGGVTVSNSAKIQLDSSYGSLGGVIVSDGNITISNSAKLLSSGQPSSYLLALSTSTSDSAISLSNSVAGAIFYASEGGITLSNNVKVKELVAYKLIMSNSAEVEYESGLQNTFFSSGPSGGWKVADWKEK